MDDASQMKDGTIDMDRDNLPSEGDLGICIRCAGAGIYYKQEDGSLGLRLLTLEEKVQLSENEDAMRARFAVLAMIEKHGPFGGKS